MFIPLRDFNPTTRRPYVTYGLVALNVLVYLYQLGLSPRAEVFFVHQFGLIPIELFSADDLYPYNPLPWPLNIVSSMFVHGGLFHLLGNMLYLWVFGDNVEDAMGHVRFALFYLICGAAAGLAHALAEPSSQVPLVGASGAIAGVLGAYLVLYPNARVQVFVFFIIIITTVWVPASLVLGFWFLLQILSLGSDGPVAFAAHISGFALGWLWMKFKPPQAPVRGKPKAYFYH